MLPFCGLPVMFVHCAQTAEDSNMISFAYDSPMSLPDHVKTWLTLVNPFLPKFMETFDGKLWPNGYTLCSEKKHPLTFSFISLWIICVFKQKLHWIYPRFDRLWQCKN